MLTVAKQAAKKRVLCWIRLDGPDAFNPAERLMAALAACMIKGIERVTPILKFELRGVEIRLQGIRQDVPPKIESIDYEILVDSDEGDHRLELLHENVKKYGTVFNTVARVATVGIAGFRVEPGRN